MATFEEAFVQADQTALRFLAERGLAQAERRVIDDGTLGTVGIARYRSAGSGPVPPGWCVSLSVAPYRLELCLDVSGASGPSYSLEELFRRECTEPMPPRQENLYEAASDGRLLGMMFTRLAEALQHAGRRFFAGDATLWIDLADQRRREGEALEDQRVLAESARAFQAKDWGRVVRLLEPLRLRLRGAAAARLEYAEKHRRAT